MCHSNIQSMYVKVVIILRLEAEYTKILNCCDFLVSKILIVVKVFARELAFGKQPKKLSRIRKSYSIQS